MPSCRLITLVVAAITTALALAIGLGVGLGLKGHVSPVSSSPSSPSTSSAPSSSSVSVTQTSLSGSASTPTPRPTPSSSAPPPGNTTTSQNGTSLWTPQPGSSWQIEISYRLNNTSLDVEVYDIDLFLNDASTVAALHQLRRRVICYFSAGSYENFRPDSSSFKPSDFGKPLDGWPGEWWLDTNSTNVRNIMTARIARAKDMGCDGIDPDNIDGYDNDTGLDLTENDAINYVSFLASQAHERNVAIGLKNGGSIVQQLLSEMQWEVNEQCVQYDECALFQPFIAAGKPVFHIEYPPSAPNVNAATQRQFCQGANSQGFSTVLKNLALDDWVLAC